MGLGDKHGDGCRSIDIYDMYLLARVGGGVGVCVCAHACICVGECFRQKGLRGGDCGVVVLEQKHVYMCVSD